MEGIFTLPYSEYEVVNQFVKKLAKAEGYSVYIPTSRQQKGIDFIVHNYKTNKILRVQVKSSRSYVHETPKREGTKRRKFGLWFNNFITRYDKGNSDYYALFGMYPVFDEGKSVKQKSKFWKPIILCFNEKEMFALLNKARTKREKKIDKFFGFEFDKGSQIFTGRGFAEETDLSNYLLDKQISNMKKLLR